MPLHSKLPLSQSDMNRLDQYLRIHAGKQEAMGLPYTHGFLTAIASGPQRIEPDEWLPLIYGKSVSPLDVQVGEMLSITESLYAEIEHKLSTSVGFFPIFNQITDHQNHHYPDAQPWCLGFTDGLKLFSENWTDDANNTLQTPLAIIFRLADMPGQPDPAYKKLCSAVPDATEYIYTYWQAIV